MNDLIKIKELGEIFRPYGIYPQDRYNEQTAFKVFQKTHPNHHFSREAQYLIHTQQRHSERIGADLPYWGKNYFSNDRKTRYFVISQDSNSLDAGSIVFYANLMNHEIHPDDIHTYITRFGLTPFKSWKDARDFFITDLELDMDYIYVTDAKKVYPKGKRQQNHQVDQKQRQKWLAECEELSRELIFKEIIFCSPDVIIAMGTNALQLLNPKSLLLEKNQLTQKLKRPINCKDDRVIEEFIYSPLLSGANRKYFNGETRKKAKAAIYLFEGQAGKIKM
ncbi:uracil-DNA glycosylase family protein [Neobacillus niacini]|uniref:uracil-DNA glycosylase family protein n=1 Tax=Neobacillus niacini TaxID=86668 RepID=UPI0021CAE61A|nr:uracil-DNA glycosylase family protein [Neobacillus niacini]MCM3766067.1 uracil-DNA glycosylase family protein [Neobacillus niacini]